MDSIARATNNAQQKKSKKSQGGYIPVLHEVEEKFYGPGSPLEPMAKILLYVRHRALRDWKKRKRIGRAELMKATGLNKLTIIRALKRLEQSKMILITRSKTGKTWNENTYELHPALFGNDYIYKPNKPTLKLVINKMASDSHFSNASTRERQALYPRPDKNKNIPNRKVIHRDSDSYQQSNGVVSPVIPHLVSQKIPDVVSQHILGAGGKNLKSLTNSPPKNPLKEPFKRTLCGDMNLIIKRGQEDHRKRLVEQRKWLEETKGEQAFEEWKANFH